MSQKIEDLKTSELAFADLETKHLWRIAQWEKLKNDELLQAEAIVKCSQEDGFLYFFDYFLMTFDPREKAAKHNPFILFDYQRDYLRWLHHNVETGQHNLLEKSRDMGATWLVVGYVVWRFIFKTGFTCLMGSQKEKKTDNRDVESLFGKAEYLLRNMPPYIRPSGFDFKKHRQFLKIINPENGNSILGDSANPDFGRQGRYSMVVLDEFAFWDYADQAWRAVTGGATPCAVAVSTPNGTNKFKHLRFDSGIPVYTMHWTLHPSRNQMWYERQKIGKTAEDIAQELDISYSKSVMGRVYPEWEHVKWGEVQYEPSREILCYSWDFGRGDGCAIIRWAKNLSTDEAKILDCYYNQGKTIDFYIPFITGNIDSEIEKRYTYTEEEIKMFQEVKDKGYPMGTHFGDPSGNQKHVESDHSAIEILKKHGIRVVTNTKLNGFAARRTKTKLLIPRISVNRNSRTEHLNDCMMEARYPERIANESVETAGYSNSQSTAPVVNPVHDWTSHLRTAVEFFAVNEPRRHRTGNVTSSRSIVSRILGKRR